MKVDLASLLNPGNIIVDLKGRNKRDVFEELINLLYSNKMLEDPDSALFSIRDREKLGSTGIGHGLAIPHSKTSAARQTVLAIGVIKNGMDFGSMDGKPVKLVVMILYPPGAAGVHLEILAALARLFSGGELTETAAAAPDPRTLYDILLNALKISG